MKLEMLHETSKPGATRRPKVGFEVPNTSAFSLPHLSRLSRLSRLLEFLELVFLMPAILAVAGGNAIRFLVRVKRRS